MTATAKFNPLSVFDHRLNLEFVALAVAVSHRCWAVN